MKLYVVELQAKHFPIEMGGPNYVVANDPTQAYEIVKAFYKKSDHGFAEDREMKSVTLLAETGLYPTCKMHLFLCQDTESPTPNGRAE
jgi:hypothetical protein